MHREFIPDAFPLLLLPNEIVILLPTDRPESLLGFSQRNK